MNKAIEAPPQAIENDEQMATALANVTANPIDLASELATHFKDLGGDLFRIGAFHGDRAQMPQASNIDMRDNQVINPADAPLALTAPPNVQVPQIEDEVIPIGDGTEPTGKPAQIGVARSLANLDDVFNFEIQHKMFFNLSIT